MKVIDLQYNNAVVEILKLQLNLRYTITLEIPGFCLFRL